MKLIERPDQEKVKAIKLILNNTWDVSPGSEYRALAKFAADIYNLCCEHYEKELERIQKLLDGAADRERIKLREERGGKEDLEGLAHEIWATAQCMPWEGIEDAVTRIKAILEREEKK